MGRTSENELCRPFLVFLVCEKALKSCWFLLILSCSPPGLLRSIELSLNNFRAVELSCFYIPITVLGFSQLGQLAFTFTENCSLIQPLSVRRDDGIILTVSGSIAFISLSRIIGSLLWKRKQHHKRHYELNVCQIRHLFVFCPSCTLFPSYTPKLVGKNSTKLSTREKKENGMQLIPSEQFSCQKDLLLMWELFSV